MNKNQLMFEYDFTIAFIGSVINKNCILTLWAKNGKSAAENL